MLGFCPSRCRPLWALAVCALSAGGALAQLAAPAAQASAAASTSAQAPAELISEAEFFNDLPVVLSVSRLAQRLDQAPGAVSVIDRDWIARSGARNVVDLLRLLPGFQTSQAFESVAPLAAYHGGFDAFSNRMQVLVDGRSVYSLYFIGSSAVGLQSVALEDIERIEVLRGSNSATFGARAMLGVVNIVTRAPADTPALRVGLVRGSGDVMDQSASVGQASAQGAWRLSVDGQGDEGLQGANGRWRLERANLRMDRWLGGGDELQVRTGALRIASGKGEVGSLEMRPTRFDNAYLQVDWHHSVSADQDWVVQASVTREGYIDRITAVPGWDINFDGQSQTHNISLTHTLRASPALRWAWGGEWRSERQDSPAFFGPDTPQRTDFARLFAHAEWHLDAQWLLNAGALAEHSSQSGDSLAPRLMLSWQPASGHTLRAGVSRAQRPPSRFEAAAQLNYPGLISIVPSGRVQPERLIASELGYRRDTPTLALDLRVFHEQIDGFIRQLNASDPRDYVNDEDFAVRGAEYQLHWQPWAGARLIWSQTYTEIGSQRDKTGTRWAAPNLASALVWMQRLPGAVDLSVSHQDSGTTTLLGSGMGSRVASTRTDLRLAKRLHWGRQRAELAWVLQNGGSALPDYDPAWRLPRRSFISLQFAL